MGFGVRRDFNSHGVLMLDCTLSPGDRKPTTSQSRLPSMKGFHILQSFSFCWQLATSLCQSYKWIELFIITLKNCFLPLDSHFKLQGYPLYPFSSPHTPTSTWHQKLHSSPSPITSVAQFFCRGHCLGAIAFRIRLFWMWLSLLVLLLNCFSKDGTYRSRCRLRIVEWWSPSSFWTPYFW